VVTASVGVAVSDPHLTGDELLSKADAAMYRAKQHHQGGWSFAPPAAD
jgi:GGDEF domain-containing protein